MTGETKIGLITGLSVIIVFAMILSHKGNERSEPPRPVRRPIIKSGPVEPPAPRTSVRLPEPETASQQHSFAERGPLAVNQDLWVSDDQIIARNNELGPQELPPAAGTSVESRSPTDWPEFEPVASPRPGEASAPTIPQPLREQIEGDRHTRPGQQQAPDVRRPSSSFRGSPDAADRHHRTYVVLAHDNLTSIARKFMGAGTNANVQRLFQMNRDRLKSKNTLYVGQEILVPAGNDVPASQAHMANEPARENRSGRRSEAGMRKYRVQPGDNYASIAREQLGNGRRWKDIYAANKSRFPDPDLVPAGSQIVLPENSGSEMRVAAR